MKTFISTDNPFGLDRYGFLWEQLKQYGNGKHLDFGAYNGNVLAALAKCGVISEGIGLELNKRIIEDSKDRLPANVKLVAIEKNSPLPFENETFNSVSILDVLEHICNQEFVLKELNRVLKHGGMIVATVPQKHLFSFLDIGNFKFVFPKLHKIVYQLLHSKQEYLSRYVVCENGMFGDIDAEKMWHQHFSREELKQLVEKSGFVKIQFDGAGFYNRLLGLIQFSFPFLKKLIKPIVRWDRRKFERAHLFCVAFKG